MNPAGTLGAQQDPGQEKSDETRHSDPVTDKYDRNGSREQQDNIAKFHVRFLDLFLTTCNESLDSPRARPHAGKAWHRFPFPAMRSTDAVDSWKPFI